jgi:predicted RNA-binding protein YlqC (UPF0109 family)
VNDFLPRDVASPGDLKAALESFEDMDVRETPGDMVSMLELRVAKEVLGRVIGKHGHTTQSLRIILNAVAVRHNRKVHLEIIDR